MKISIRADSVVIEGYVNAVERKSKLLWSRIGQFVERICKGAFKRALERNDNVRILLNHNPERDLGGTLEGNLELYEDNIGLHARATITDADVVQKAKTNKLVGWSFGFYDREVEQKMDEEGYPLRDVIDLDLVEVSLLDDTTSPAYDGTLVTVRTQNDTKKMYCSESFFDGLEVRTEASDTEKNEPEVNYEKWDALLEELKA